MWNLDLIDDSNKTGALEFNIRSRDADAFFPIQISFASQDLYCTAAVTAVTNVETGAPIAFGMQKGLLVENFRVE